MKRILFDLETNGLLRDVTKVWCAGLMDLDTGETQDFGPDNIEECLPILYEADLLVGHNIIAFDLRVLKKLYNWDRRPGCNRLDTLVASRLISSDIVRDDKARQNFPSKEIGSHSLRAWGLRLGVHKGDYGHTEETSWDHWTPEMTTYMMQDLVVNHKLLQHLKPGDYPQGPLELEHRAAEVCQLITEAGWPFNEQAAQELYVKLATRRDELEQRLRLSYPPWKEVDKVFVPKRDNTKRGYVAGVPFTKYKEVTFNPGSRVHIERKLREAGWVPQDFTDSGRAKLDEEILLTINIPEAKDIIEYLLVQKRLGQIGDGDNAWLKQVFNGKIHGSYNSLGCVSRRASHSKPNVSQVPANGAPYGAECRDLFGVPYGWELVGADMAGLELRTLAHYLAKYDDGEYARVVTSGDPHWYHATALDLVPPGTAYDKHNDEHLVIRGQKAKRWIYAWLYGAQPPKLSTILMCSVASSKASSEMFLKRIPAIAKRKKDIEKACKKGYLKALDGGYLRVRSAHSALNVLLQGAGAILCKRWMVDFYDAAIAAGYRWGWGGDFVIVGWIHDELQVAVKSGLGEAIGDLLVHCAERAGDTFGLKVPLNSDYSIGRTWKDTH